MAHHQLVIVTFAYTEAGSTRAMQSSVLSVLGPVARQEWAPKNDSEAQACIYKKKKHGEDEIERRQRRWTTPRHHCDMRSCRGQRGSQMLVFWIFSYSHGSASSCESGGHETCAYQNKEVGWCRSLCAFPAGRGLYQPPSTLSIPPFISRCNRPCQELTGLSSSLRFWLMELA